MPYRPDKRMLEVFWQYSDVCEPSQEDESGGDLIMAGADGQKFSKSKILKLARCYEFLNKMPDGELDAIQKPCLSSPRY